MRVSFSSQGLRDLIKGIDLKANYSKASQKVLVRGIRDIVMQKMKPPHELGQDSGGDTRIWTQRKCKVFSDRCLPG